MKALKIIVIYFLGGTAAVCGIVAIIIFWMTDPFNIRAPSDRELIATFSAHRAAFEKLRQMVFEDKQSYFSKSYLDSIFDAERRRTYKTLLFEIHSGLGVTN